MAERMAAEIQIGGPIPRKVVAGLIVAIEAERLQVEWDGTLARIQSEADLVGLAYAKGRRGTLLLTDDQATWGQFADLEGFLVEHGVAFDRQTEGKYDYSPELVQYRSGMKEPRVRNTSPNGEPVVAACDLQIVLKKLQRGQSERALKILQDLLGPKIPPLEPLRIVEDDHALPNRVR